MSFPTGVYILRASPVIGVDGLYATGNGDNEIITVEPHRPPFIEHQTWHIKLVDPKEGKYLITRFPGSFGGHWHPKDKEPIPDGPVITSEEAYEWYISYFNVPDVHDTITIRDTRYLRRETLFVGTKDEKQVVIKGVPQAPGVEPPYWQFTPVFLD